MVLGRFVPRPDMANPTRTTTWQHFGDQIGAWGKTTAEGYRTVLLPTEGALMPRT